MDNQGSVQVLVWLVILAAALAQNQDDVFKGQAKDIPFHRCLVNDFERVPCGDPDIDRASCEDLNCCFDQAQCFYAREVTVQCFRDGQFRVVVSRDTTIPHLRLESVSLLESNDVAPCGPVHTTATFVVFHFPVSTCGTTMMEEEGYVVYENKLSSSYELGIGPLGTITRDSVYELSFLCRYIGSEVVSLVAEVNTVPPPLPVAAPGPLHVELRLANGQCDSKGCSDATAYSSYYAESDYPVTKVLRDPLYVEVRILGRTDPNIVLTLEHCWATSSSIPLSMPQWSLLVDGCPYHADPYLTSLVPVDGSSGLPNPTHYKRFIVKMFTFIDPVSEVPQKETVFIHCSTAVCYPSAGNACEHACGRKRRHAARMARSREASDIVSSQAVIFVPQFTSLARNLSDGDHEGRHAAKITQSREETAIASSDAVIFEPPFTSLARSLSDGDHEVPQSLAYGLLGVAAAVVLAVFALVLAVVWRSRHRHVAATKL